jgi:DNA-binding LytR/AlgR family response regulator
MIPTLLRCSILDDSNSHRSILTEFIKNHPNLILQCVFEDHSGARDYLEKHPEELLFIKIEMTQASGFEFLDNLSFNPDVIFIANETKSAFKAFEYSAIDYLQTPVKRDRFLYAVEKAILHQKIKNEPDIDLGDFIFVKSNLKKRKVYLNSLKYIQALGDYVKIITQEETLIILSTMKSFEKSLPNGKFRRIHKSYIVNIDLITKYNCKAVELCDEVLPLSRNRKTELINALKEKEECSFI